MIEKVVLDYLAEHLDVPVYMQEPANARPDDSNSFVVIEKTGSGEENHLYTATLAIQSYGPTLYDAARLNELAKACMDAIIELDGIAESQLQSDYVFNKVSTKQPRYQAVYDITHY